MNTVRKIETAIVTALVEELKAAGYVPVKVYDGGEYVKAPDLAGVLEAVFSVDESTINFAPAGEPKKWGKLGVFIVGGNGEDCISDYHCGDPIFAKAVERACDRSENIQVTA